MSCFANKKTIPGNTKEAKNRYSGLPALESKVVIKVSEIEGLLNASLKRLT